MADQSYPPHCRTLESSISEIRRVLCHPSLMVERFSVETITPNGDTLKFKWDRKNVGQDYSVETIPQIPNDC